MSFGRVADGRDRCDANGTGVVRARGIAAQRRPPFWRKALDNANGSSPGVAMSSSDAPPLGHATTHAEPAATASLAPGGAHRPAMIAPRHAHGSVLEGGDSPTVLAQPPSAIAEHQGSAFDAERSAALAARRARQAISEARWAMSSRYRRVSDHTDDYVHDNPWKSIALGAIGGLLVGLLISR
jgi:ElaB/YqjD/DUF883 family membrane-anchored ribosome-binding protein